MVINGQWQTIFRSQAFQFLMIDDPTLDKWYYSLILSLNIRSQAFQFLMIDDPTLDKWYYSLILSLNKLIYTSPIRIAALLSCRFPQKYPS
jgi:hypothetical protein